MTMLIWPFIGYWAAVFLWIKGTDPLESTFWRVLWIVVRSVLVIIGSTALFLALS